MSRSTICAWSTMFVRLCAGPSCICRAISRRMSSWAVRIIRDTPGGSGPSGSTRCLARGDLAVAAATVVGARRQAGDDAGLVGVRGDRSRGAGRRTCACPRGGRSGPPSGRPCGRSSTSWLASSVSSLGSPEPAASLSAAIASFSLAADLRVSWRVASVFAWLIRSSISSTSPWTVCGLRREARGELGGRRDLPGGRRIRRAARPGVGIRDDLSPPAS